MEWEIAMNMLFTKTWEKVVSGAKTQTRRIVTKTQGISAHAEGTVVTYHSVGNWSVGGVLAVMPARGVRGLRKVADIEITRIRREDIREISEADAIAEGFALCPEYSFWRTWCKMHDVSVVGQLDAEFEYWENPGNYHPDNAPSLNGLCRGVLRLRPAELYTAWALDFRVVNVYADAVAKARELLKAA